MKPTERMRFFEVMTRLTSMEKSLTGKNGQALRIARDIVNEAATESLLSPPAQITNVIETDLSKVEERMVDYLAKHVGPERARTFIPGDVQLKDLKSPEAEAELNAPYRFPGTHTARVTSTDGESRRVPVTNRNGVSQTPSDWYIVYDGPQVFVIGDKFKLAFPASAGPTISAVVRHHNDETRKHKGYSRGLEAANTELNVRNERQLRRITALRDQVNRMRYPLTKRCTRNHNCWIFRAVCNGVPRT